MKEGEEGNGGREGSTCKLFYWYARVRPIISREFSAESIRIATRKRYFLFRAVRYLCEMEICATNGERYSGCHAGTEKYWIGILKGFSPRKIILARRGAAQHQNPVTPSELYTIEYRVCGKPNYYSRCSFEF